MCGPSSAYFYSTRSTAVLNDWRNGWRAVVAAGVSASRRPRVSSLGESRAALRHAEWVTVASERADEADQSARGTDWNGSWARTTIYEVRAKGNEHHFSFRLVKLRANELVRIANHRQTDVFMYLLIFVITDFVIE